ncbi:MAG TPA: hypothetical protein VFL57_14555 [Bryobacteraceae bacterium]|nr:hypothetical protein [Bryobacteraceae bacterium]
MERAPWRNARIVSTLLLVFLFGAAAGALTVRMGFPPERHKTGPYWTEGGKDLTIQKFKKELDLTPAQAAEIETILDDFMTYYQTLEAQVNDVRATGKKRILRILNEDQKQKFERMLAQAKTSR